jgi:hypothetical protein
MSTPSTITERLPQLLAEQLDSFMRLNEQDTEVCRIITVPPATRSPHMRMRARIQL